MNPVWTWLGRVPFGPTVRLQEHLRDQVVTGEGPETLLLLEHDPVITLGRSADPANVLVPETELAQRGVERYQASRGGDVTYHGPGQLVGYPIVRVRSGVVGHLRAMADGLSDVLAQLGIAAHWDRAAPGLWVDGGEQRRKICAFGVHIRHRVAIHGFALNVAPDLRAFQLIVPCGLPNAAVTSIQELTGAAPSPEALAPRVAAAFRRSFAIDFAETDFRDVAIKLHSLRTDCNT